MPKTSKLKEEIKQEILGIFFIALAIFIFFCLGQESVAANSFSVGAVGGLFCFILKVLCGQGKFLIPLLFLLIGILKLRKRLEFEILRLSSIIALLISILAFFHLNLPQAQQTIAFGRDGLGGGVLGGMAVTFSLFLFGKAGSYIFWSVLVIASFVGIAKKSLAELIKQFFTRIRVFCQNTKTGINDFLFIEEPESSQVVKKQVKKSAVPEFAEEDKEVPLTDLFTSPALIKPEEKQVIKPVQVSEDFQFPDLKLLKRAPKVKSSRLNKDITNSARVLESTLANFDVQAKVVNVSRGPGITRYEIQPAPGIKVSRIVSLADDIALSLATSQVRIEAPIPGKAAVGIEVPNKEITIVTLREVLETGLFQNSPSELTVALGKDITGNPIVADLAKMPHLLIAGATGSGKSVCMNALIISILYKGHPEAVKMLLIDPKVVEFSAYNGIPHLISPVITDPKKAAAALRWMVSEMENRYELFAEKKVKDIQSYNQSITVEETKLPYIIVFIDELADLMMVAAAEVEDAICRLAQMARAAGIHLVVATQRPSVDVITGVIKANIPSRIAFAVSSQTDSRTILDLGGAERLLGRGDMLFYPTGLPKPIRVQGVCVSDAEINSLVEFFTNQATETDYIEPWTEVEQNIEESTGDEDPLLGEAIKLFLEYGQASISLLQRRLKIGYTRAARIIDYLEDKGMVGGYEGSKPRAILITWDEYYEYFGTPKKEE